MPLRSMTGYGVASRAWADGPDGCSVEVEVRSVNARFREVKIRQPFGALSERAIRKSVEARVGRGRVDVSVHVRRERSEDGLASYGVEPAAVAAAAAAAASVRDVATAAGLELRGSSPLELLRFITSARGSGEGRVEAPSFLDEVVGEALDDLVSLREREGAALEQALAGLVSELTRVVLDLDPLLAAEQTRVTESMTERLARLTEATGLPAPEQERVRQEVAALLLRGDVTEERVRIDAHLQRMAEVLGADAAPGQGKTLDFLCQELFREITTIGSKIGSHQGSSIVIDAKAIVERLREQVQNVE